MDTRPMRADARRNRERLIAAARTAFMERGTDASLDDIAKRAGVGSGTLYRHFPTRDALLHAVLRERLERLVSHAGDLLSETAQDTAAARDSEAEARVAEAALGRWLRAYLADAATPHGTCTVIMQSLSAAGTGTALGDAAVSIRDALGGLLRRAQRAGAVRAEIEPADLLRITSAIGAAAERAPDPATYADRMLVLLFDGLRTR
ncbi:MAG TPA: helix-turn-helix domain-containing protein [Spirillospora sp.]